MKSPKQSWDMEADVVVVGSGSGAFICAMTSAVRGAKVVLVERAAKVGGGTAYSGGHVWMPNNHRMAEVGLADSREEALTHLRRISGGRHSEEVLLAYVDHGPKALEHVERLADFQFEVDRGAPDYFAELPGGKMAGRSLNAPLFASKSLGEWEDKLIASPHFNIPTTHFEVSKWGGRSNVKGWDWGLIGKRLEEGMRGWGAAYSGYLLRGCLKHGVKILLNTRARALVTDGAKGTTGIRVEQDGRSLLIRGRQGVLLGCGGYEWNKEMKSRLPWPEFVSNSVPTNEGDGITMAVAVGAATATFPEGLGPALHIPGEEQMGKPLYRSCLSQIAAPGAIVVNRAGRRFGNESFMMSIDEGLRSFDARTQSYPNIPAYMIVDQKYKDSYAIGTTMPGDEAPSWLSRGKTPRELAQKLGIDAEGLEDTVARFNDYARRGVDPEYHRGEKAFERGHSIASHQSNPCLAPLEHPPFYGVEVYYCSAGTRSGVVINGNAQVLDVNGAALPGLYACANTAAHLVCGMGYNSGLTLGQSTVFGYLAALHMAR
ncbi:MAG: FAD-binding protein [Chloroflexi bacterium]|nr:FAD-binding protein [Chloroflexota bacterium]